MMLRTSRLNQIRFSHPCRFASSSASSITRDHYSTLGISRTATAKEVKSAFYELSKQYHPDRNPDDKDNASMKFQDIVNAYEILSNTEKRKEYDRQFVMPRQSSHPFARRQPTMHQKQYTDLDLDYRDLEHFQRMARRRRNSQAFSYETAEDFLKQSDRYKSSLAADREREERRIREEMEEKQRRSRFKTPTFEELLQHERRRKSQEFNKKMGYAAVFSFTAVILISMFTGRHSR